MKKLIYIAVASSFLFAGCSGESNGSAIVGTPSKL